MRQETTTNVPSNSFDQDKFIMDRIEMQRTMDKSLHKDYLLATDSMRSKIQIHLGKLDNHRNTLNMLDSSEKRTISPLNSTTEAS